MTTEPDDRTLIFEYTSPDGGYSTTMEHVRGPVYRVVQKGYFDDESSRQVVVRLEEFLGDYFGTRQQRAMYLINHLSELTGGTAFAKRNFLKFHHRWPQMSVVGVGVTGAVRALGVIYAKLVLGLHISFAKTEAEALIKIEQLMSENEGNR